MKNMFNYQHKSFSGSLGSVNKFRNEGNNSKIQLKRVETQSGSKNKICRNQIFQQICGAARSKTHPGPKISARKHFIDHHAKKKIKVHHQN